MKGNGRGWNKRGKKKEGGERLENGEEEERIKVKIKGE